MQEKKIILFRVKGYSMRPFIREGNLIFARYCSHHDLRPGDIVVFGNGTPWVHRLIRIKKRNGNVVCITKGDGLFSPDPPWPVGNLIGKVIAVRRSDNKMMDQNRGLIKTVNRLLGYSGYMESMLYSSVRVIKRNLFGSKK